MATPPRTNSERVKKVLAPGGDYDLQNAPDLQPFIDTATAIIDDVEKCAASADVASPMSKDRLELIERWLAAHCYKASDQPYSQRSTGKSSGSFQGQTGMYLEGTKYGQMALSLDTSGCLYALVQGEGHSASAVWLGKPKSRQVPYNQRR